MRLEETRLAQILHLAASHALLVEALALATDEDRRHVFLRGMDCACRQVGHARPLVADHHARLPGHAKVRFGHEAAGFLVMRRDHAQAAFLGGDEHGEEARIGNAEDRIDAFGLEQLYDALVNLHGHLDGPLLVFVGPVMIAQPYLVSTVDRWQPGAEPVDYLRRRVR